MHSDEQLESRLRGLTPRKPSQDLYDRVIESTSTPAGAPAWRRLPGTVTKTLLPRYVELPLAIAASLLIVLCLKYILTPAPAPNPVVASSEPSAKPSAPIEVYQPTRVASTLVSCERERVRGDSRPMYKFQFNLVDDLEWENRRDGTVVRMTRPRQEVVIVECPLL